MVVCQIFNQLRPDELYDWINQLWSRIEFKSTLVICSQNKANYFGESMQTFPCVKYISSVKSNLTPSSYLEEPNFIGGLPAARNFYFIWYKTFLLYFCLKKIFSFKSNAFLSPKKTFILSFCLLFYLYQHRLAISKKTFGIRSDCSQREKFFHCKSIIFRHSDKLVQNDFLI